MKKLVFDSWDFLRRIKAFCRVTSLDGAVRLARGEGKDREIQVHLRPTGRPVVLRGATSDITCLEKVFVHQDYKSPFPIDPRVIVDAGANIGMATLYFAQEYPKAKIIAIEPEPSNFKILEWNCAGLPNVVLVEGALWRESRALVIQDERAEKWAFSVAESATGAPAHSQQIKAVTIPGLLRDFGIERIDILKLDIEGAERELFAAGAESWLGSVGQIVIELHDRYQSGCARAFYAAVGRAPFAQEVRGENIFIKFADSDAAGLRLAKELK
jgi:FkbM family methyltransferase